ncbi:MAG: TonB-dependent receptor [Beijerinckiaceae bacterium]
MKAARSPRSLRSELALQRARLVGERAPAPVAVACMAIAGAAEAQTAPSVLPQMTVDAPAVRKRPTAAPKPSAAQLRARAAMRQRARSNAASTGPTVSGPSPVPTFVRMASDNPYAQPGDPYKVNRLASPKFTEPLLDTPRTITVLSKEVLEDKGATTLRELGRSTAGVTLGTGEGGNAFGDRFFIRGFDARGDVFVDGMRDPAVSVRENFFTEQVEILRGPASSFAGRGTAGGAINIVVKKATTDGDFRIVETTGSPTDRGGRVTIDVNQVINPKLAVRVNGLLQDQKIPGRDIVTDHRAGASLSVLFKPTDQVKLNFDYIHTDLNGLPDFGVPYNRFKGNRPFTEGYTNRNTWYGFANRDFQHIKQDMATLAAEIKFSENVTLVSKLRREQALLSYVGTLAESPAFFGQPWPGGRVSLNAQSRYQPLGVLGNQNDLVIKYDVGPTKNTTIFGAEFSHEQIMRDTYSGLSSESTTGTPFSGSGSTTGSLLFPPNYLGFGRLPLQTGNPTNIAVDTKSAYAIHTTNFNDFVFLNGGLRWDDYRISSILPASATASFLIPGAGNPWNFSAYNHSSLLNYNLGLVVKPKPWWSLYGAYATSANPVGAELDGTTAAYGGINPAAQVFAPELNKAIEVGSKWELFDKKLLLTAALFQTTKTNAREVIGSNVYAVASYRVQGIDLEVAGKITDKWSVIGGLVFMQSKILKSQAPTNIGLPLANIAHASFSLLSKYQVTNEWEVGGQAVYNSRRYGGSLLAANGGTAFNATTFMPSPTSTNPFVNVPTVLPSYWRFDAFTEYKLAANLTAKLQVLNLFNRTYYDGFYQSAAPFAQVAPGRSIQFNLKATF